MAGSVDMNRSSIVKLNSTNYHLWKFGAEMLLLKENLWSAVAGNEPETITQEWIKAENAARGTIALSIDAGLHHLISDCTSARQMWLKIKTHFERASYSSKIFLKRKLYTIKLEGNNMEAFIHNVMDIVDRLRLAGEVIRDSEIVSMLLCGLSEEYDNLILAIENKEEDKINLEQVRIKLMDEAKRKEEKSGLSSSQTAMLVGQPRSSRNQYSQERVCYNCNQPGHIRFQCPKFRKTTTENPPNRTNYQRGQFKQPLENIQQETNFCSTMEQEQSEYYFSFILLNIDKIKELNSREWIIDSGASNHMCNDLGMIERYKEYNSVKYVKFANGSKGVAKGEGFLSYMDRVNNIKLELDSIVYVPEVIVNIISISQLCKQGYQVIFDNNQCEIKRNGQCVAKGQKESGIFKLVGMNSKSYAMTACIHMWHERLGHRSLENLGLLKNSDKIENMKIIECGHDSYCKICGLTKLSQSPFESVKHQQSEKIFQLLHTDLCGPISPQSKGGGNYFVIIVDDFSRYCYLRVIKRKSEASDVIKEYIMHNNNRLGYFPQFIRSDGGGEFESMDLRDFLKQHGIVHQISIPYASQQNGISERINRTIIQMTKAMLLNKNLNKILWGEAAATSCYLYNRLIHSYTKETPYARWMGRIPRMDHLRVMGSPVIYLISNKMRSKLSNNGREGILLGYGDTTKGYRILDKETDKIIYSKSVKFDEGMPLQSDKTDNDEEVELIFNKPKELECDSDKLKSTESAVRRSQRTNIGTIPVRYLS